MRPHREQSVPALFPHADVHHASYIWHSDYVINLAWQMQGMDPGICSPLRNPGTPAACLLPVHTTNAHPERKPPVYSLFHHRSHLHYY